MNPKLAVLQKDGRNSAMRWCIDRSTLSIPLDVIAHAIATFKNIWDLVLFPISKIASLETYETSHDYCQIRIIYRDDYLIAEWYQTIIGLLTGMFFSWHKFVIFVFETLNKLSVLCDCWLETTFWIKSFSGVKDFDIHKNTKTISATIQNNRTILNLNQKFNPRNGLTILFLCCNLAYSCKSLISNLLNLTFTNPLY